MDMVNLMAAIATVAAFILAIWQYAFHRQLPWRLMAFSTTHISAGYCVRLEQCINCAMLV